METALDPNGNPLAGYESHDLNRLMQSYMARPKYPDGDNLSRESSMNDLCTLALER